MKRAKFQLPSCGTGQDPKFCFLYLGVRIRPGFSVRSCFGLNSSLFNVMLSLIFKNNWWWWGGGLRKEPLFQYARFMYVKKVCMSCLMMMGLLRVEPPGAAPRGRVVGAPWVGVGAVVMGARAQYVVVIRRHVVRRCYVWHYLSFHTLRLLVFRIPHCTLTLPTCRDFN